MGELCLHQHCLLDECPCALLDGTAMCIQAAALIMFRHCSGGGGKRAACGELLESLAPPCVSVPIADRAHRFGMHGTISGQLAVLSHAIASPRSQTSYSCKFFACSSRIHSRLRIEVEFIRSESCYKGTCRDTIDRASTAAEGLFVAVVP